MMENIREIEGAPSLQIHHLPSVLSPWASMEEEDCDEPFTI